MFGFSRQALYQQQVLLPLRLNLNKKKESSLRSTVLKMKFTYIITRIIISVQESMGIISDLDGAKVQMGELWNYICSQRKEQQYNDYKGVSITPERIAALKSLIKA